VNGIKLLREGKSAADVVKTLTAAMPGASTASFMSWTPRSDRRAYRQGLHRLVRLHGRRGILGRRQYAGGASRHCGNRQGLHCKHALPFPRRLIAALKAGEAAGGDKRGKQSAAL
jgi:hypothetical protein